MNKDWVDYTTLGIALIALAQPWITWILKKIFDKPVLECFANKGATLTFDDYGVGLYCTLTMISNKCDNVITNIEINIYKGNSADSKIYHLNWDILFSIYKTRFYSEYGSSQDTTSFTPCPMYLTKGTPISYRIRFRDEKLNKEFLDILESDKGNDYIRDTLLTNFNYRAGNHRIEIIFTDINGKKKAFPFNFELSTKTIDDMKLNATIISDKEKYPDIKDVYSAYIELEKGDS